MVSLGVHRICHQNFVLPFLLSKQVDETCYVRVVVESLPVASLTDPKTWPFFPHPVVGYAYFRHVSDETFLRSPWRLWCICGTPPFFSRNHCQPLCIHPFVAVTFQGSEETSLQNSEQLVLAWAPWPWLRWRCRPRLPKPEPEAWGTFGQTTKGTHLAPGCTKTRLL
jgi:hypothetical protein